MRFSKVAEESKGNEKKTPKNQAIQPRTQRTESQARVLKVHLTLSYFLSDWWVCGSAEFYLRLK